MERGYNDLFKVEFGTQLWEGKCVARFEDGTRLIAATASFDIWFEKQRLYLVSKCFSVASSVKCRD
jgi:hypothetical protein